MNTRYILPLLLLTPLLFGQQAAKSSKDPLELVTQGQEHFLAMKPREAVAAFDQAIALAPQIKPRLWQRGLALYYCGEYQKAREQFETHQTHNTNDVENAAWHYICVARATDAATARKQLIPIQGDSRVPMREIQDLFAGTGTTSAVLTAAKEGAATEVRNQLCYAHLYLGLYHEAHGDADRAKHHILKAACDYTMDHYMGRCAQVHAFLRGWEPKEP